MKKISKDSALENAKSGLEELFLIHKSFKSFSEYLFGANAAQLSRLTMKKAEVMALNQEIDSFLYLLSPYLMLSSAQVALEWLIFKHGINVYNQETYFFSFLPFHETKIFSRAMMLIDCKDSTSLFYWLKGIQSEGRALARDTVVRQFVKNKWLTANYFSYIEGLSKCLNRCNESGTNYSVIFSFFSSLFVTVLDFYDSSFDQTVDIVLPKLLSGLSSETVNYCYSSLTILNKLVAVVHLNARFTSEIISKLIKVPHINLKVKLLSLIHMINSQEIAQLPHDISELLLVRNSFETLCTLSEVFITSKFFRLVFDSILTNTQLYSDPLVLPSFLFFVEMSATVSDLGHYYADTILQHSHIAAESPLLRETLSLLAKTSDSALSLIMANKNESTMISFPDLEKCLPLNAPDSEASSSLLVTQLLECFESKSPIVEETLVLLKNALIPPNPEIISILLTNCKILNKFLDNKTISLIRLAACYLLACNIDQADTLVAMWTSPNISLSRVLRFFFRDCSSVALLLPTFLQELSLPIFDRYFLNWINQNSHSCKKTVRTLIEKLCVYDHNIEEAFLVIDIQDSIIDLINFLKSPLDDRSLVCFLLLISRNIGNYPDALPNFVHALHQLTLKTLGKKWPRSNRLFKTDLLAHILRRFLKNKFDVVKTIMWSLFVSINQIFSSKPNYYFESKFDVMTFCVYMSYSHKFHKRVNKTFSNILGVLVAIGLKNQSMFVTTIAKCLVKVSEQRQPSNYLTFTIKLLALFRFISELVSAKILAADENLASLCIALVAHLQDPCKEIRISALSLLKNISLVTEEKHFVKFLSIFDKRETLITNDPRSVTSLLARQLKNSSKLSDFVIDIFLDYLKQAEFNSVSLFCLSCLSTVGFHPDIINCISRFFEEFSGCRFSLANQFLNQFSQFLVNISKDHCHSPYFFKLILGWSLSNDTVSNRLIAESVMEPLRSNLLKLFDDDQKIALFTAWLNTVSGVETRHSALLSRYLKQLPLESSILSIVIITALQQSGIDIPFLANYCVPSNSMAFSVAPLKVIYNILKALCSENSYLETESLIPLLFDICEFLDSVFDSDSGLDNVSVSDILKKTLEAINAIMIKALNCSSTKHKHDGAIFFKPLLTIMQHRPETFFADVFLDLLSNVSKLHPDASLDYLMPMFTFVGSYSVKRDDERTLAHIGRAIEVIVPAVYTKLSKNGDNAMAFVIDSFASSYSHVPKHRHQPLFETLVKSFPSKDALGAVILSLFSHNEPTAQLYDFTHELCSAFSSINQIEAFVYILSRLLDQETASHASSVGRKRKSTPSLNVNIGNLISLMYSIISADEFKKGMFIEESLTEFHEAVVVLIKLLFPNATILYTYTEKLEIENLFLTLFSYCNQFRLVEYLNSIIPNTDQLTHCINILYRWSSTQKYNYNEFEEAVVHLAVAVIDRVVCDKTLNQYAKLFKKSIFVAKNILVGLKDCPKSIIILEKLVDVCSNVSDPPSLAISLAWAHAECFKAFHNQASHLLPRMLDHILNLQISFSQKSRPDSEILLKCLRVMVQKNPVAFTSYLTPVFSIIHSSGDPSPIFNDFESVSKQKDQNRLDSRVFDILHGLAVHIPTDILLPELTQFLQSNLASSGLGSVYLLYLIHIHILRTKPALIESNVFHYSRIFTVLFDYRSLCFSRKKSFCPLIEFQFLFVFYKYSLKQTEAHFMDIYSNLYDCALGDTSAVFENHKLITFYELTAFLFDKLGSLLLPFVSNITDSLVSHLNEFLFQEFVEQSSFACLAATCKVVKNCLLYDTERHFSAKVLLTLCDPLLSLMKLRALKVPNIDQCIDDHIVPSIGYLAVCLTAFDSTHELLEKLQSALSHSSQRVRASVVHALRHVFEKLPDQIEILLPHISSHFSILENDTSTKVTKSFYKLKTVIARLSNDNQDPSSM